MFLYNHEFDFLYRGPKQNLSVVTEFLVEDAPESIYFHNPEIASFSKFASVFDVLRFSNPIVSVITCLASSIKVPVQNVDNLTFTKNINRNIFRFFAGVRF